MKVIKPLYVPTIGAKGLLMKFAVSTKPSRKMNVSVCFSSAEAAKRVVHPNLAARKKSQLGKLLREKEQAAKAAPPAAPQA